MGKPTTPLNDSRSLDAVRLIKIGARAVRHARYVRFQLAEVAVSSAQFAQILARIARLPQPHDTG